MLRPLLESTTLPLLKQVARFAERRQDVLAGNIANLDTPGYRMRDLPVQQFQQALEQAIASRHAPSSPGHLALPLEQPGGVTTTPASIEDFFPESLFAASAPSAQPGITFQDANNRSLEDQFLQMTKNSVLQQFALEVMRTQFDQLQTVISERA